MTDRRQSPQPSKEHSGLLFVTVGAALLIVTILCVGILIPTSPVSSSQVIPHKNPKTATKPAIVTPPADISQSPKAPIAHSTTELFQQHSCTTNLSGEEIYQRLLHTVVVLQSAGRLGSGFIVATMSAPQWIATNEHVIHGATRVMVTFATGQQREATVKWKDVNQDLALVQLNQPADAGFQPLPMAQSTTASPGAEVWVMGAPEDLKWSITKGIISAHRTIETNQPVLQLDAAVNHGNSGGPAVDRCGRAVGVVSFKSASAENLNFARPVELLSTGLQAIHP